jgi:glycerophosphoryl diester phosphodiesterase
VSLIRIGHKGADALEPGNTLDSFAAAARAGADVIELDVLRPRADFAEGGDWRRAPAGPASNPRGPLLVAHDWADAERRRPLTLAEVLDAFRRPPLAGVRFDLDLKIAGREDEVVEMLRERSLIERAMVSTMEVRSLELLSTLEPELARGWTLPRVDRDWDSKRWARPLVIAGSASLRARLPGLIRARAPRLAVWAVWIYHPLITPRLVAAAHEARVAVVAWTVDEPNRIGELAALGVDGICSNDPRLLAGV